MNIFDLAAKISLDTREYESGVKKAESSQTKLSSGMQNIQGRADSLKSRMDMLSRQYSQARSNVQQLTNAYNKSAKETGNMSSETKKLASELEEAEDQFDRITEKLEEYTDMLQESEGETEEGTSGIFLDVTSKAGAIITAVTSVLNVLGSAVTKIVSWAGDVINAIGSVTSFVVSSLANLSMLGMSYNMEIESYMTNFRVMLGDAESAAQKVEDLREMAASTPFGLSDLASATQTLLGFGIEGEKTNDILLKLGDVSLGNAQKLQSLTLAFSQATSSGKLMGQDLLQMINAGFNPLQQLVSKTGLSVGQLKEIMSGASEESLQAMMNLEGVTDYGRQIIEQGYISATDLQYALEIATSEGGQFFNGMEESSKTLTGLLSTLKDDAMTLLGEFVQPLSDMFKTDILPNALSILDAIKLMANPETAAQGSEMFSDILNNTVSNAVKFINDNAETFIAFGMTLLVAIADGVEDNADILADTTVNIATLAINASADNIPSLMSAASKLLAAAVRTFFDIVPAVEELLTQFGKYIPEFIEILIFNIDWEVIAEFIRRSIFESGIVAIIFKAMLTTIQHLVSEIAAYVAFKADDIINAIKGVFVNLGVELVKAFATEFDSAVKGIYGKIQEFVQNISQISEFVFGVITGEIGIDEAISSIGAWIKESPDAEILRNFGSTGVAVGYTPISGESVLNRAQNSANIEKVDVNVNIGGTNATPQEISDAVTEAMSISLYEFTQRRGAAYGFK